MIQRLRNKINKEYRKHQRKHVPYQAQTTFIYPENWGEPLLIGAETLLKICTSADTIRDALQLVKQLESDDYLEYVKKLYQTGLDRFGNYWTYSDLVIALMGVSKLISVENYMEIGVRRGRSMAVVASQHPKCHIVGFDMWISNYCGMENPGPKFVEQELGKVGFIGKVNFINGDSKKTVPGYFKENPGQYFDVITVDGDHSRHGATVDLKNVITHLKIGGLLIFDDIVSHEHPHLISVWNNVIKKSGRFETFEYKGNGLGIAIGIRKY